MSTRKYSTLMSIGAVAGLLTTALVGSGAQAAEQTLGNVTCKYGAEVHSVSNSKGDIRHEIYGAWQFGAAWPVTSSISPGYSSTYSSWDVHHWMFHKNESGGRAKASSAIASSSLQCR